MPTESLSIAAQTAARIRLTGRVQGLGVRPKVARLAQQLDLAGMVSNTTNGVSIEIAGNAENVTRFCDQLRTAFPAGAVVERYQIEPIEPGDHERFEIVDPHETGSGAAIVPVDRVVCQTCLDEVLDPTDRRYDYPFTSCTTCGPRYSLISSMPYDRPGTSLDRFPLCSACASEYRSPNDRRFHAQTMACPECGPNVWLVDATGRNIAHGTAALDATAAALRTGQIVALKGLGGYQLLVDATSNTAVQRLRERKHRATKPLAVMVCNIAEAERIAFLDSHERHALTDPAGPIVVVKQRSAGSLSTAIAPDISTVGLMLPMTPLHALLANRVGRPLVVTSGNREAGALAYDVVAAERDLRDIADVWLHHDRPIVRPIDDSVVRVIGGSPCVLRLARGFAPLSLPRLWCDQPLIALGGEQKSAIALSNGHQAVLGPHVGDLTDQAVCERWHEQLASLATLYSISLDRAVIVHDAHPDYFTTHWAEQHASQRQAVFHHHAHIAAEMHEHRLDGEVLGLAWDGTGYGPDGTIWGGEALRATRTNFHRVATLRPFPLPGGERAIREPWRVALALVGDTLGLHATSTLAWPNVSRIEINHVTTLLQRPHLMPQTSSMGRLFDAIAALALGIDDAGDDGRPAMRLELCADRNARGSYSLPWDEVSGVADWRPLIAAIVHDLRQGYSPGEVSMRFHRTLADWAVTLSNTYANLPMVISGGVFQNALLRDLLAERLADRRAGWYAHESVPPGDGGLAVGQLAVAAARLNQTSERA
jgi:hydrogenase maturation protein HypF